jgi:uncharacterized membrane protein YeiH
MDLIFLLEIIGTIAFGLSGAFVAVKKKLDYFGAAVLTLAVAVGGGMMRDVILGITPPIAFSKPVYSVLAFFTAAFVIIFNHFTKDILKREQFDLFMRIVKVFDAIGLGIFTVIGAKIATAHSENMFLAVFVGVITGVGGGVLRDILANRTPLILRKEIYALASIIGAVLYIALRQISYIIPDSASIYISVSVIILIRLIAVWRGIHLPRLNRFKLKSIKEQDELNIQ